MAERTEITWECRYCPFTTKVEDELHPHVLVCTAHPMRAVERERDFYKKFHTEGFHADLVEAIARTTRVSTLEALALIGKFNIATVLQVELLREECSHFRLRNAELEIAKMPREQFEAEVAAGTKVMEQALAEYDLKTTGVVRKPMCEELQELRLSEVALQIELQERTDALVEALRSVRASIQPNSFRSYRDVSKDIDEAIAAEMKRRTV